MSTWLTSIVLLTAGVNVASGIVSIVRPPAVVARLESGMTRINVPASWSLFPIGTLKVAGGVGLTIGLLAVPPLGLAAAIGLVLFWVCATYTHLLAADYSGGLALAGGLFLPLAVASLVAVVAVS